MQDNKPVSMFESLQNKANQLKQIKEMTVDSIENIEQATLFIKDHDSKVTNSWFLMCHALRKVRDNVLYEGKYDTFKDYFEGELKYTNRMVYNFIQIAESFPLNTKDEIIQLGVTKLLNLSELDEENRESFLNENDVENMTAKDIKTNIKNPKKKFTQEHEGIDVSLSPDEYIKVQEVYKNFNKLNLLIEEVAIKNTQETPIDYNQMYVLYDKMKKTKNEIRQMEKMLRKYI